MKTVTVQTAKAELDSLLQLVAAGEVVEIAEANKPLARIVPADEEVDWSDTFEKLNEIWGSEPLPGKPASTIVIENRR